MRAISTAPLLALAAVVGMTVTGCQKRTVRVEPNEIPNTPSSTRTPPPAGSPPTPGTVPAPTSPTTPKPDQDNTPSNPVSELPRLRVIHGVAGGPTVDIFMNDASAGSRVAYKSATAYTTVPSRKVSARATAPGSSLNLLGPTELDFATGGDYTVIATGDSSGGNIRTVVLSDDNRAPLAGEAKVRVIHAASDAPAVDVLLNDRIAVSNLAFGRSMGPYAQFEAGKYQVKVLPTGSDAPALGPLPLELKAGKVYTIVALGKAADRSLNLQVYTDN